MLKPENTGKIVETLWLFWAYLLIGFDNGLIGPCVPDLRILVEESLERMSYIFLLQGFGALFGNLVALVPERHFDRRALLGLYVLLGSMVNVVIPLKADYNYMLVFFLLQGTAKGMTDFAAISFCNALWEENKALPFQFIIIGAGIGTFISPIIAQPFIKAKVTPSMVSSAETDGCPNSTPGDLAHPLVFHELHDQHFSNLTDLYNATVSQAWHLSGQFNASDVLFGNLGGHDNGSVVRIGASGDQHDGDDFMNRVEKNEDIKWPFIIAGLVTLPSALAFIFFYITRPKLPQHPKPHEDKKTPAEKPATIKSSLLDNPKGPPPSWTVYVFRGVLIFLHIPVFGLLLALADLLTSIGMMPPLCLTAKQASYFTTVLWAASMLSRALGVLFLLCISVFVHLLFNSLALVVMGVILVIGYRMDVALLWLGTAGVGLFATNFMPGYIAWSEGYVPITALFMNLSLCLAGTGELLLPFVSGQMLAAFGPWVMLWMLLMVMVLMLLLFLFVVFVGERFLKGRL